MSEFMISIMVFVGLARQPAITIYQIVVQKTVREGVIAQQDYTFPGSIKT